MLEFIIMVIELSIIITFFLWLRRKIRQELEKLKWWCYRYEKRTKPLFEKYKKFMED